LHKTSLKASHNPNPQVFLSELKTTHPISPLYRSLQLTITRFNFKEDIMLHIRIWNDDDTTEDKAVVISPDIPDKFLLILLNKVGEILVNTWWEDELLDDYSDIFKYPAILQVIQGGKNGSL
jgi:hypothetical protein